MNTLKKTKDENISVIILAAGMSERFGRPKAFLKYSEEETFLERLIHIYSIAKIRRLVIIINKNIFGEAKKKAAPLKKNNIISLVINMHPEAGRFTSIKLGIDSLPENSAAFIQNIDNPFTTSSLLQEMKSKLEHGKYVVPVCKGKKEHPVLLSAEILERIRNDSKTNSNVRDILAEYKSVELKTDDERLRANINTEKIYQRYFSHETIN